MYITNNDDNKHKHNDNDDDNGNHNNHETIHTIIILVIILITRDTFAKTLLGPFAHEDAWGEKSSYHFDVDKHMSLFNDDAARHAPGALVLSLEAVSQMVDDLEREARRLME